jgi:hypothetical protein
MNHLRFLARTDVVPHEAGAFFAEAGKSLCAGAQMEAVGTDIHFDALIWNRYHSEQRIRVQPLFIVSG